MASTRLSACSPGCGKTPNYFANATACYAWRLSKNRRNRLRHQSIIGNLQAVGQAVSPASEFFSTLGSIVHEKIRTLKRMLIRRPRRHP